MSKNPTAPNAGAQRVPDPKDAEPNPDGSIRIHRYYNEGLELWVGPRVKTWRCRVQRDGKRVNMKLGYYPAMSKSAAREARSKIRFAEDPVLTKRLERSGMVEAAERTFRLVAAAWMETRGDKVNWSPGVRRGIGRRLETYALPALGELPVSAITADDVLNVIKGAKSPRGRTAVALRQHLSGIFAFALRRDWCATNLVQKIAEDLPTRKVGTERNHASVATIEDARAVLAAVEARAKFSAPWTLLAHRLIALTAGRGGEIRGARWSEFDLAKATWTIPAERMKMRREHLVPLSPQAIEVVRAAARLRKNEFVFPSQRKRSETIDRSTLTRSIRTGLEAAKLGRIMVAHGWRGTFSTIMNEIDPASFRVVEATLAHKLGSKVEAHYNHATYWEARQRLLRQWADMLLDGAPTALALIGLEDAVPATNVVPLRKRVA